MGKGESGRIRPFLAPKERFSKAPWALPTALGAPVESVLRCTGARYRKPPENLTYVRLWKR